MSRRHFTSSDGVRLAYDDLGPANGTPIVLCHGIAAAGEQMAEDAAYFAGLGYRVLVPDLRGHGHSDAPVPITAAGLAIARLAADQFEMLDHAGVGTVHWVGNSLGGIVALEMLPAQRFRTFATFGTIYAIKLPQIGGHHVIAAGHRLIGANAIAAIGARSTTTNVAARKLVETLLRQMRPEVIETLAGVLSQYDLIANGVAATLPILMLRGGRDGLVNAGLGATLAAMRTRPNFTLVELPKGGHCANLDATDEFRAALLSFWSANADISPF